MRIGIRGMAVVLAAGAHLIGAVAAEAQLSISRFTVDAGGGTSSGGAFVLSGTAGQLDAGVHIGGSFELSGGFWLGGGAVTGIGDADDDDPPATPVPPLVFQVFPLTPNPMTDRAALAYQLPEPTPVRAEVFDASGRLVRVLIDAVVESGRHEQAWDRRDHSGVRVPAGIYFVRLDAGGKGSRQKIVVIP